MRFLSLIFKSSIGRKAIMAVTGVILIGFVIGHLAGNLQIFAPPEYMNVYAHFLHEKGPLLWVIRVFLLAAVGLHIWAAVVLTLENGRARPRGYKNEHTIQASYASRTMHVSGVIVLAFLLYHLAHFTFMVVNPEYRDLEYVLADGTSVLDVHAMIIAGFQNVWISVFYIVAVGLLSMHLSHGLASLFQSLGLRSGRLGPFLQKFSLIFAVVYFIGNAAIPVSVLAGIVQ